MSQPRRHGLLSAKIRALQIACALAVSLTLPMAASAMELKSTSFEDGGRIALSQVRNGSGCSGQNNSPGLLWTGAPPGTKSFAVTLFDVEASGAGGRWHWVLVNIPAKVTTLGERAQPGEAISTKTDFGIPGYLGPCPPVGDQPHRYVLTIYALDVETLPLNAASSAALASALIQGHVLAKASIAGYFGR